MKTQLRSSQPTSARRQHQPLESAAEPSYLSEGHRRVCQGLPPREKQLGQHSTLTYAPHALLGSTAAPGGAAAGLQETTDQKEVQPRQVETGNRSDLRYDPIWQRFRERLGLENQLEQHSPLTHAPHAPLGSTAAPRTAAAGLQETTEQKGVWPGQVETGISSGRAQSVLWRIHQEILQREKQQGPDRSAEQVSSDPHTVRTEDRDRKIPNRLSRHEAKGGEESSASGMSSTTPGGRRRVESEQQPATDRALKQETPDPHVSQVDEAFRELLDRLVRWQISTPEDVKPIKNELAKLTNTLAPVSALSAEAERKGSSGVDAASIEIRPGASRAEGGGESSTLEPSSTGPLPPEVLRNHHGEVPQETPDLVRPTEAEKPEVAKEEGRDEAMEEAESLAFDVVDRLDGGDPDDEYVFHEVEGYLGKDGEDGAGMCHVSYKESPEAVDDEYVLL